MLGQMTPQRDGFSEALALAVLRAVTDGRE